METFSASLALCAGNSRVTGELSSQRPVTRSFDVFFDLCLNKPLSKQSWGWWFETLSRSLWRHCNVTFSRSQGGWKPSSWHTRIRLSPTLNVVAANGDARSQIINNSDIGLVLPSCSSVMESEVPQRAKSKVHGANMGPTWVLSAPDGSHVGPMNLTIMVLFWAYTFQFENCFGFGERYLTP